MDYNDQAMKEYQALVKKKSPNSKILKDCLKAFFSGGLICVLGQFIMNIMYTYGLTHEQTSFYTTAILLFIGSLLTGLGLYEKIGKHCGAGTIVPIIGFSNSITSPALEFKKEGFILGMAAKMFTIAGPVIVYGTVTSVIVGLFYYFFR